MDKPGKKLITYVGWCRSYSNLFKCNAVSVEDFKEPRITGGDWHLSLCSLRTGIPQQQIWHSNGFPTFHIFLNHHDWADCGVVYQASMHHRLGHVFLIVFRSFSIFHFFFFLSYVFIYSHGLASHEAIELEGGLFWYSSSLHQLSRVRIQKLGRCLKTLKSYFALR